MRLLHDCGVWCAISPFALNQPKLCPISSRTWLSPEGNSPTITQTQVISYRQREKSLTHLGRFGAAGFLILSQNTVQSLCLTVSCQRIGSCSSKPGVKPNIKKQVMVPPASRSHQRHPTGQAGGGLGARAWAAARGAARASGSPAQVQTKPTEDGRVPFEDFDPEWFGFPFGFPQKGWRASQNDTPRSFFISYSKITLGCLKNTRLLTWLNISYSK